MKFGFPGGPRLEWYDRNPIARAIGYDAEGVASHVGTLRASYTVPSGKKLFVTEVYGQIVRYTAATGLGRAQAYFGTNAGNLLLLEHYTNTVGAEVHEAVSQSDVLLAGDVFGIYTGDGSTGGTMDYHLFIHAVEFNA